MRGYKIETIAGMPFFVFKNGLFPVCEVIAIMRMYKDDENFRVYVNGREDSFIVGQVDE